MRNGGRSGQVLVEMLLILPVFLTIVFTVMEIGYLSFRLILLNHATYEVARIGGMTWVSPPGHTCDKLNEYMRQIRARASVDCERIETLPDPQRLGDPPNADLMITGREDVQFVFPTSTLVFRSDTRKLTATVRMPIEMPLNK